MLSKFPAIPKHHLSSFFMRGIYCAVIVTVMLLFGTVALHHLEGFSYLDAFYFTSMIATGQGPAPNITPETDFGKIFTSVLAFFSVGIMLASFSFLFGPFLSRLLKIGVHKVEDEIEHLQHKNKK